MESSFSPRETVSELDKFIIGQKNAKRSTEEFVDIESRLKTKREIRDRYIQILRDKTGSISDVLEAEEAIRTITEELKQKKVVYAF